MDDDVPVTIPMPPGLLRIIDHFSDVMGFSREEAALHFIRNDAGDWYATVMRAEISTSAERK